MCQSLKTQHEYLNSDRGYHTEIKRPCLNSDKESTNTKFFAEAESMSIISHEHKLKSLKALFSCFCLCAWQTHKFWTQFNRTLSTKPDSQLKQWACCCGMDISTFYKLSSSSSSNTTVTLYWSQSHQNCYKSVKLSDGCYDTKLKTSYLKVVTKKASIKVFWVVKYIRYHP